MAAEQPPSGTCAGLCTKITGPPVLQISILLDHNYSGQFTVKLANSGSFEIPNLVYLHSQLEEGYKTKQPYRKHILIDILRPPNL